MSAKALAKRKDETAEEKSLRRAEKKGKVERHRAEILARVSGKQAVSKVHASTDDFACPIRFTNELPDVPVEQRYIAFPFDEDFVTAYDVLHGVSSETARPRAYHPEPDLGVGIPLVEPAAYMLPEDGKAPPLHPEDAFITSDDFSRPAAKKSEAVDPNKVEWVLFSQHLHNDLYDAVYKHSDATRVQADDFARRKAKLAEQLSSGSKRTRIEAAFAACAGDAPLVHPDQPKLQPKRVWEIQPDAERTGISYVVVAFDMDPDDTQERKSRKQPPLAPATKRARLEHALLRTPAAQAVNARDSSTMVHLLLPEAEDVDPAVHGAGSTAEPVRSHPVRDYSMIVDSAGAGSGGLSSAGMAVGEDTVVWAWDDMSATITYAPVKVRAFMTRVREADAEAAASTVAVHRRPLSAEEEDVMAEQRALLDEVDPTDTLLAIKARNRERRRAAEESAEFAEMEAANAFSNGAAGSSSSNSQGGAGAGGGGGAQAIGLDDGLDDDDNFDI